MCLLSWILRATTTSNNKLIEEISCRLLDRVIEARMGKGTKVIRCFYLGTMSKLNIDNRTCMVPRRFERQLRHWV